jgi:hypothetical protein
MKFLRLRLTKRIHTELPSRAMVTVEGSVDSELVRAVLGSLLL